MTLKDKIDTVFKLEKELDELGIIDCLDLVRHGKSVQFGSYDIDNFINLSNGEAIEIYDRESDEYPYEATFKNGDYTFFVILNEDEKTELEKLINESEADKFINGLGSL